MPQASITGRARLPTMQTFHAFSQSTASQVQGCSSLFVLICCHDCCCIAWSASLVASESYIFWRLFPMRSISWHVEVEDGHGSCKGKWIDAFIMIILNSLTTSVHVQLLCSLLVHHMWLDCRWSVWCKTYKLQYGAHMHNQRFLQLPKIWSVITIWTSSVVRVLPSFLFGILL